MKILLVGGTSKFGKSFLKKSSILKNKNVEIITTSFSNTGDSSYCHEFLNLGSKDSINNFLSNYAKTKFNTIICAASVYSKCETYDEAIECVTINALGYLYLLKKIKLFDDSKVVFFTDAGTSQPKFGYSEYTLSKDLIKSLVKILPVERNLITLGIDMGPVISDKKGVDSEEFKSKSLVKFKQPIVGLVSLIDFILGEENYFSAGTILDFSGGTYLKRGS